MFVPVDADDDYYADYDTKQMKAMNDLQLANKHFHKDLKRIKTKTGKKTVTVEYYSSGPIKTIITHALSGVKQRGCQVGSVYEDLYFKVGLSNSTSKDPITLFYYSPEEYEKHQYIQLSDDIKNKWNEKYLKASIKLKEMSE